MATERIEYHPVVKLFPAMSGEEQEALTADIEAHGLREPIVLHEGKLVDGRHRLAACAFAGVEPRFVEWDGNGSLVEFVWSKNFHRRHLSPSQLAAIAAEKAVALEREAAEERTRESVVSESEKNPGTSDSNSSANGRGKSGRPKGTGTSKTKEAAESAGASVRNTQRARRVQDKAPDLHEQVKAGEISLHAAEQQIVPPPPSDPSEDSRAECIDAIDVIAEHAPRIEGIDHAKATERLGQLRAVIEGKKRRAAVQPTDETDRYVIQLWDAYPRKEGKGRAVKAIRKALADTAFTDLLASVKEYAIAKKGEDSQFIPHPATWFNDRRWEDDRQLWKKRHDGRKPQRTGPGQCYDPDAAAKDPEHGKW